MAVYRSVAEVLVEAYDFNWENNQRAREVCICSVEMICANVVNVIVVIFVALLLKIPIEVFIYFITFAAMRFYAGGAHAKNYIQCIFIYVCVMLSGVFCTKCCINISYEVTYIVCALSLIIPVVVNYKYAAKQKAVEEKKNDFRKRTFIILAVIESIIFFGCVVCPYISLHVVRKNVHELVLIQAFALLAQSITLFIGRRECIN